MKGVEETGADLADVKVGGQALHASKRVFWQIRSRFLSAGVTRLPISTSDHRWKHHGDTTAVLNANTVVSVCLLITWV